MSIVEAQDLHANKCRLLADEAVSGVHSPSSRGLSPLPPLWHPEVLAALLDEAEGATNAAGEL